VGANLLRRLAGQLDAVIAQRPGRGQSRVQVPLEAAQVEGKRREVLGGGVVQFPGQVAAFQVPHLEQAGREPVQFLLGSFAGGEVARHDQHLGDPAPPVLNHAALRFDMPHAAGLIQQAVLQPLAHAGPDGFPEGLGDARAVVGMHLGE